MKWFYIINIFLVFFSWKIATLCYNKSNKFGYYSNMAASALNGVIVLRALG